MKSKSAGADQLHQLQHHHQNLFNSGQQHLLSPQNQQQQQTNLGNLTAAQILSYAAQISGGKGLDPSSNSWDPTVALQMSSALFGGAGSSNVDNAALAQLNAASQLIAASLLQQQQQQQAQANSLQESSASEPFTRKSSSSKQSTHSPTSSSSSSATTSSANSSSSPLLCSFCGQASRDQAEYEAHLLTHISLAAGLTGCGNGQQQQQQNQAYQYLLRMQNALFSQQQQQQHPSPGSNGVVSNCNSNNIANSSTTSPSTILNKKRKLLAASQATEQSATDFADQKKVKVEGSSMTDLESLSLSRLGLETLLKGSASADSPATAQETSGNKQLQQQAQSLLAQLAAAAASAQSKNHPTSSVNSLITSSSSMTTTTSSTNSTTTTSTSSSALSTAFPCTSCHKTFATEVDLKAHLIRHLTQHPFVCVSCGKGFKYEHSLNFHIKSYHSGGGGSSANGSALSPSSKVQNGSAEKLKSKESGGETLKLKKSRNNTAAAPVSVTHEAEAVENQEFEPSKQPNHHQIITSSSSSATLPTSSSSLLHSRLTLMDENHNASGTAVLSGGNSGGGSGHVGNFSGGLSLKDSNLLPSTSFLGKPPLNLPSDSPIQIRSERLLVSVLEAVNLATDQSLLLYKCCLCCVAFASLDQMATHVANVHPGHGSSGSSSGAGGHPIDLSLLLSGVGGGSGTGGLFSPKEGSSQITGVQQTTSTSSFACDKCTAKFSIAGEFEMHMQLHRTLEAQAVQAAIQGNGAAAAAALYNPFNLLSHLTGGNAGHLGTSGVQQTTAAPATVDFRQMLANASKDTDFGRKFAAQLLQQDSTSSKDHHHHPQHPHHHLSPSDHHPHHHHLPSYGVPAGGHHRSGGKSSSSYDSFVDRCCSGGNGGQSSPSPSTPSSAKMANGVGGGGDANNNSLLYLSLLPEAKIPPSSANLCSPNSRFSKGVTSSSILDPSSILNLSNQQHLHHLEKQQHTNSTPPREKPIKKSSKGLNESSKGCGSSSTSSSNGSVSGSNASNSNSTSSLRHIKEPVDIFEGAGQSLPIQKFPLGDIEETAPGQFKCRFCEKTFDRVFSVHRHERVHTGFKPCICKTCGRGFSEKRNLRHHIIRFHSDGSGRELLKRKRKPKSGGGCNGGSLSPMEAATASVGVAGGSSGGVCGSPDSAAAAAAAAVVAASTMGGLLRSQQESFMSTLLGRAAGNSGEGLFAPFNRQGAQSLGSMELNGTGGDNVSSLSNLKLSLAEMDRLKAVNGRNFAHAEGGSDPVNLSNGRTIMTGSSSASRRKGSKPSKKVYEEEEEEEEDEDEDEDEEEEVEDHDNHGQKMVLNVVPMAEEDDDEESGGDEEEVDDEKDIEKIQKEETASKEEIMGIAKPTLSPPPPPPTSATASDGEETEEEEEVDAEAELKEQQLKNDDQAEKFASVEDVKKKEEESLDDQKHPENSVTENSNHLKSEDEMETSSAVPPLPPKKVAAAGVKGRGNRRAKRKSK